MLSFDDVLRLPPLWERLAAERRPILLYGTGNGADKILDVMARRGVPCAGVFASDGFVREREFRGMRVTSYAHAAARFGGDVVILVAFGSPRDDVLSFIGELSAQHTVYVPDVPLFADDPDGELFTREYAIARRDRIERAASLYADDGSRELFFETLAYRLTGDAAFLMRTEPFARSLETCLPRDIARAIDGGAFTGDTSEAMLAAFPGLRRAVCVEPDARSFRRLAAYARTNERLTAVNASLGATVGVDLLSASASRASSVEAQNRRARPLEVRRLTVDALTGRGAVCADDTGAVGACFGAASGDGRLFIKLDVEGAESAALDGARETLAAERPALAVAAYHRTADVFELPIALSEYYPDGGFRLRRARCLPCWELTLFAG